jgi:hypothetical protein
LKDKKSMALRQSSPYQTTYKQTIISTPPRSGLVSSPGTEKKEYNAPLYDLSNAEGIKS